MTTPLAKNDFFELDRLTWLYNGAEAPVHRGVRAAYEEYMTQRAGGPVGRAFNARIEESFRQKIAQLLNGDVAEIALLSNASEAISSVLLSLGLTAGDNIVMHTLEYPSAVLAGLALETAGVELRIVPHQQWTVGPTDLMQRVDEKTRLVITSHVSYLSGARFDYRELYRQLQNTSALLLLDATQSLGVVQVDLEHADFVVCSSYKWLLGIHGAGILGVNSRRTRALTPASAGWRSVENLFSQKRFEQIERFGDARRFELGFPSYPTLTALEYSVGVLLECGIDRIEEHVLTLGSAIINELEKLGMQVMTPHDSAGRAGNIAVVCANGEAVAAVLAERNILTWGGDGRLRVSVHGYSDQSDVDRFIAALRQVL